MLDIEQIKLEIIERLKPLNPNKIILFGSYAYGKPREDSDIDLYIVTNDEFLPNSFQENKKLFEILLPYAKEHQNIGDILKQLEENIYKKPIIK